MTAPREGGRSALKGKTSVKTEHVVFRRCIVCRRGRRVPQGLLRLLLLCTERGSLTQLRRAFITVIRSVSLAETLASQGVALLFWQRTVLESSFSLHSSTHWLSWDLGPFCPCSFCLVHLAFSGLSLLLLF